MFVTKQDLFKKLEESNQKLIEYMDITRKEALESYRKGLQDGINIQLNQVPQAAQNPVKSVEEHKTLVAETQKANAANEKVALCFANLMGYDGKAQKKIDEN